MSALPVPGAIDPDHEDAIDTRPDEDELDDAYRAARGDDGGTAAGTTWFRALGRLIRIVHPRETR